MIKVAHLFNEINFSGAEIMYAQAAALFQAEGFELTAVSTGKSLGNYVKQYEEAGYCVLHQPLPTGLLNKFHYYVDFYHYLKRENIKVVHIHKSTLVMSGIIAFLAKARCIKTQHNTFKNRWFTRPYAIAWRFILRNIFKVTFHTIGESVYLNELHYYKNPSVRINNWFDKHKFYPAVSATEKQQLRKKLNISDDAFVLVSTGGCSTVKNHHAIIKALPMLKEQAECVYLHLGQGKTEVDEQQLAEDLGVMAGIRFLGNQNNVRDYLLAADVYVMPSQFEGLGNAALEAMACHLPCVLYDAAGLRDLIKNNDNGLLIKPDHTVLAESIISIIKNPELANERADNALNMVNQAYSMESGVQKMIVEYRR